MHSWAQIVRSKLICMFTNMFYRLSDAPTFLVEQVDLIGGIDFICLEVCGSMLMFTSCSLAKEPNSYK